MVHSYCILYHLNYLRTVNKLSAGFDRLVLLRALAGAGVP